MNLLLRTLLLAALAAGTAFPAAALDLQRLRMMTAAEQVPWRAVGRVNIVIRYVGGQSLGQLENP
jgi:hypothetical protein